MSSLCSVCQRNDSQAINAALRENTAGRNALADQFGIARTTLSRHIKRAHHVHPEEPPMESVVVQYPQEAETPTPQLVSVQTEHALIQGQLAALQAIVTDMQHEHAALTSALGQQRARLMSYERRVGEIEARVQALAGQVGSHGLVVTTVQELLDLLAKNDDCWQVVGSLLNTGSTATKGTLHQVVAEKVGRPRPLKYIRQ
jgi:hypothetical protein